MSDHGITVFCLDQFTSGLNLDLSGGQLWFTLKEHSWWELSLEWITVKRTHTRTAFLLYQGHRCGSFFNDIYIYSSNLPQNPMHRN